MHTPTKAHMQIVIANLKKVLPRATRKNALSMMESAVNANGHECGTIHCFAGWYAVAVCDTTHILSFEDGKEAINNDLGFTFTDGLSYWAFRNPDLWGNKRGGNVWSHRSAFLHPDKRPHGATTLQHIIDHLEEVRDRLPETVDIEDAGVFNF